MPFKKDRIGTLEKRHKKRIGALKKGLETKDRNPSRTLSQGLGTLKKGLKKAAYKTQVVNE